VGEEEQAEVLAVLEARALSRVSGMTPPTRVATFEVELCRRMRSRYALAVTSGTAALEVALAGLGIGPGDEVIVPALNFISSPETVLRLGAIPVFAEVDEGFGLDPHDVARRITPRTRAVMPLHVHGAACRIDAVMEVARRHGLRVLENGAWSCGATYQGRAIGTFGDAGIYSLQSVKVITAGEGGVVLTGDPTVYERAYRYHDHGNFRLSAIPQSLDAPPDGPTTAPTLGPFIGAAFRMNEITGALALAQLRKLDNLLERTQRTQRAILAGLRDLLADAPFTLRDVPDPDGDCGIAIGLIFRDAEQAQRYQAALRAEGVPLSTLYGAKPVYTLPQMQSLQPVWTNGASLLHGSGLSPSYEGSLCPRTEDLMRRVLMLSVTPDYTGRDVQEALTAFAKVTQSLH
jgi:8-amino-3,8-dideoxy-alpha-D-manno-octulosonate transaminase